MRRTFTAKIGIAMMLAWLFLGTVHCFASAEKTKIRGLIVGRTGDTLAVKSGDGNITVDLTDSTKAQKPKGLGLRKTQMSFSALIPGLKITVAGVYDAQNRLIAKTITFSGDDLQAAEAVQAGLTPTQQAVGVNQQNIEANRVQIATNQERIGVNERQIAENDQEIKDVSERFSNLTEFDTKGETTIYFASGSKSISTESQSSLRELARNAESLQGTS